jgi:hypothetical protein
MNRKEFLKTGTRIFILAGMAASTGYLVINNRIDSTCSKPTVCNKCGQFTGCELPLAKEFRKNEHLDKGEV